MSIKIIDGPAVIEAAGEPPKLISEFVGRVVSATEAVSVAVMESAAGWFEPGQTPEFDEFTVVLEGELTVESSGKTYKIRAGQAVHAPAGERVRYSTPDSGARYVSVCLPAFSPDTVHRDPER
jgi:ethanolamine utilization protein EutQ (cupin superfamily)